MVHPSFTCTQMPVLRVDRCKFYMHANGLNGEQRAGTPDISKIFFGQFFLDFKIKLFAKVLKLGKGAQNKWTSMVFFANIPQTSPRYGLLPKKTKTLSCSLVILGNFLPFIGPQKCSMVFSLPWPIAVTAVINIVEGGRRKFVYNCGVIDICPPWRKACARWAEYQLP